MSRIANNPVTVPSGVEVKVDGRTVQVKGTKGQLATEVHEAVEVGYANDQLTFAPRNNDQRAKALVATMRTIVNNMVVGVSQGFERRLALQGVGYRAQAQGRTLNLQLGYSHPVQYAVPAGIDVETPSQTEIVVKGVDKQLVGQVSAEIRGFRPPEPYKGKGVRYADEQVRRKEAKKK
jgi:large subunit ribosomal protein L6